MRRCHRAATTVFCPAADAWRSGRRAARVRGWRGCGRGRVGQCAADVVAALPPVRSVSRPVGWCGEQRAQGGHHSVVGGRRHMAVAGGQEPGQPLGCDFLQWLRGQLRHRWEGGTVIEPVGRGGGGEEAIGPGCPGIAENQRSQTVNSRHRAVRTGRLAGSKHRPTSRNEPPTSETDSIQKISHTCLAELSDYERCCAKSDLREPGSTRAVGRTVTTGHL